MKEMGTQGKELVAANEPTVMAKPLLDPIIVENGQSDGHLSNSTSANECDRGEVLSETNNLLNQFVVSEEGPWWQGWGFSRYARFKCEMIGQSVV